MLFKLKHRERINKKAKNRVYPYIITWVFVFGLGFFIGWIVSACTYIKIEGGSLVSYLVLAILFALLIAIIIGLVTIFKKMDIKINYYLRNLSYLEAEQFTPLARTVQMLFWGSLIIILAIVIGLILLALHIGI